MKRRNESKMLQAIRDIHDPGWELGEKYQFELHTDDGYYWMDPPACGFQPKLDTIITDHHREELDAVRRLLGGVAVVLGVGA